MGNHTGQCGQVEKTARPRVKEMMQQVNGVGRSGKDRAAAETWLDCEKTSSGGPGIAGAGGTRLVLSCFQVGGKESMPQEVG